MCRFRWAESGWAPPIASSSCSPVADAYRLQREFPRPSDAISDIEVVDYAKDSNSGKIVAASDARSWRSYVCPRPGCGGRVFARDGGHRRAHFAHHAGQGTPACDEYHPGSGSGGESPTPVVVGVEEELTALGLVLGEFDGVWALNLRLPEIPSGELGDASLASLRTAFVDIFAGPHRHTQISALELRPGVGAARVSVPPSLQEYRTQPVGTWPPAIDHRRWHLESRGLDATGTLFRLRHGEWTRLVADSGVHQGETLLVLANKRCPFPKSLPSVDLCQMHSGGIQWILSEVVIPDDLDQIGGWLANLGYELVPKPWQSALVTTPRGFTERGHPMFWVGDTPLIKVEAPTPSADTCTYVLAFETNRYLAELTTSSSGVSYVAVVPTRSGPQRFTVAGDARSTIDLQFIERPSTDTQLESVANTPRLQISIGEACLKAWGESEYAIKIQPSAPPRVVANLGDNSARARVTVWQHGLRSSHRSLSAREVDKILEGALCSDGISLIEIDGDAFGRVVIAPMILVPRASHEARNVDRLECRDRLLARLASRSEAEAVATLGRLPATRIVRPIDAVNLVRSRLALRKRHDRGESMR